MHLSRTAKSWRPDTPTLVSSRQQCFRIVACDGGNKARLSGETTKETVKTIARGMPDVSGVTVVTCLRAFYFCTQGCGRTKRPAFPAPSDLEGRKIQT